MKVGQWRLCGGSLLLFCKLTLHCVALHPKHARFCFMLCTSIASAPVFLRNVSGYVTMCAPYSRKGSLWHGFVGAMLTTSSRPCSVGRLAGGRHKICGASRLPPKRFCNDTRNLFNESETQEDSFLRVSWPFFHVRPSCRHVDCALLCVVACINRLQSRFSCAASMCPKAITSSLSDGSRAKTGLSFTLSSKPDFGRGQSKRVSSN